MAKMKRPLLSIVVPTKNRYIYLYKLIDLIQSFNNSDIELVIQDNTENNSEFIRYFDSQHFCNIHYFHCAESLSMAENSDLAILNSKGEYVCFIGDDDGVLPNIIEVVQYLKENNIEALISSPVLYNWPDFIDHSIYQLSSAVIYKNGSGKYRRVDAKKEINNCLRTGIRDLCKLPKTYQGLVKRTVLDKVYEKAGTFFPGGSPDMANAIALAIVNPKMVYLDSPLIISGQCKSVGGGERLMKKNELPLITEVPFLPKNISQIWDDRLPRYWCADTIWPQSAISAFKAMGVELPKINFNHILATFIFDHPYYYKECNSFIKNRLSFAYYLLKSFFVKGTRYIYWHLSFLLSNRRKRAGNCIERNLNTINEAVQFLYSVKTKNK